MAAFLSGLVSGGAAQAGKNKDSKLKGILGRKKKTSPSAPAPSSTSGESERLPGFKRGGRVRKTGLAKVHKNEQVLTKKQAKRYRGSKKR